MADPLDILYGRRPQASDDEVGITLAGLVNAFASIPERRARAAERRAQLETEAMNAQTRAGNLQVQQQQLQRQQDAQQKAAEMDQAVNRIVSEAFVSVADGTKRLDRARVQQGFAQSNLPVDVQAKAFKSIDDLDDSLTKFNQARDEHKARVINAVLESPDVTQGALLAISDGVANGWLSDGEKQDLYALLASGQDPRAALTQARDSLTDKYKPKEDEGVVVPPEGTLVQKRTGKELFKAPAKETTEKAAGEDAFVNQYAKELGKTPDQLTSKERLAAHALYAKSDDKPSMTVRLPSGMTPGQAFQATRQLRNDYERETKSAKTVNQQLAQMKSSLEAVRNGASPAGSQGVLVTFQKILDPTSVVRESEYARSASGLSLLGRIEGAWDKIKGGGAGVTVKDLEQFVNLAEQFAKDQNAFADSSKRQIDAIAKEYGLKPENITTDHGDATAPKHVFSVDEVKKMATDSGETYATVKAALERKGHTVK